MNPSSPVPPAIPAADVQIVAGVVDVVVLAPAPHGRRDRWRVLTLRRAAGVRCTGAWELVHGSIEPGELPAAAARREVFEETGMVVQRLYALTVNPFYLTPRNTIQMAVVFAAVVEHASVVMLSNEHDTTAWRTPTAALKHLAWPREHEAVRYAIHLLRDGDAGAVEDVLRVPDA